MKKILLIISTTLLFAAAIAMSSFAEEADDNGPSHAGGVSKAFSAGETGSNIGYSSSMTFDMGCPGVDPVLGLVPDVHVQMKTGDGNLTDGFTTNATDVFDSPMEGFCGLKCRFENCVGDVFYRVYTEEHGWTRWAMNEMDTDWFNDAAKVTAVQLRIKGHTRNLYDLYYKVVLENGTVLDWAHDGQTAGTIGTGHYIQKMQVALWKHDLPYWRPVKDHFRGANGEGIVFAGDGTAAYSTASGAPYTGWAYDTLNNKYYFVESAAVTGWQDIGEYRYYFDEKGKLVTDLEPVMGLPGEYIIKVNKPMKTMTIVTKDPESGKFNVPFKVFLCTIGSSTPIGEFKTFEPHRWKFMHDDIYVQYLLRYKLDGFCIHSIIYRPVEGSYHLVASTYNQLGKNYSDGCIRLSSGDAAWVFNNCGANTPVVIYEDEWIMGPFDRPCIEQAIPLAQNWDPTDPVVINDLANHTGPFTAGQVTVAYPEETVQTFLAHGDYDLAYAAGKEAGVALPEDIEEKAAARAAAREAEEKKD